MNLSVKIEGDKNVKRALAVLARVAPQKAMDAANETALAIEKGAKERAAVLTGRMRRSIHARPTNSARKAAEVRVGVNYGLFVELGTSRMRAQPFLVPAYAVERPRFIARIKKGLNEAGKEAARVGGKLV